MFLTMPHYFTHAEHADMVFVYGFYNGNAFALCIEYSLLFPKGRVPDSRVSASVYGKLRETGALPSSSEKSKVKWKFKSDVESLKWSEKWTLMWKI